MNPEQEKFFNRRTAALKLWPWAMGFLVAIWMGGLAFVFIKAPLFGNPFVMLKRVEAQSIEEPTLYLLASIFPILAVTVWFLLLVLIIFFADRMHTEGKFIQIIRQLQK